MTKISFLAGAAFTLLLAVGCGSKHHLDEAQDSTAEHHQTVSADWPAMDEFHMIMAESFHPYKDSMNLAPAKTNAEAMATLAAKWAESPLPEKVNNDEVKAKLQTLKNDAAAFATTVKTADDKTVGEALTALHDQFHAIQEHWYGEGEHHHH